MSFRCVLCICCLLVSPTALAAQDPFGGSSGNTSGVLGIPLHETGDVPTTPSQRADDGKMLRFKSQTTLVEVPVVVTDKSGVPITTLTQADFKVMQDGKEQHIVGFEKITAKQAAQSTPAPAGPISNVPASGEAAHSVTLMVLDTVNTPFLNQANARSQLIKYLAGKLQPNQAFGLCVITSRGVKVLSGITTDPNVLIAALKKATGEVSPMELLDKDAQVLASTGVTTNGMLGGISPNTPIDALVRDFILRQDAVEGAYHQAKAIEITLRAFLSIAWSLSGVPGRKSLVWVTGSFPFYLDSYTTIPGGGELASLYERAMKALNDAQISVYPVDAHGLLSDPTFAGDNNGSMLGAPEGGVDLLNESSVNSLKNFAKMTGGVAYYNTNDLSGAFRRAAADSSSYYLLTYYLDTHNTRPGWRKLQVNLSRKDVEVRARAGFLVTAANVDPDITHKADMQFALGSPLESTGIAVTARWLGTTADGTKKKIAFALQVPESGLIDEADKNHFDLEFLAQATLKGTAADTVGQTIKGNVRAESMAKLKSDGIFYKNALDLPPGDYQVRFIVRDNVSGRIGSLTTTLAVN